MSLAAGSQETTNDKVERAEIRLAAMHVLAKCDEQTVGLAARGTPVSKAASCCWERSQHHRYVPPSGHSNFFVLDVLTNVLG